VSRHEAKLANAWLPAVQAMISPERQADEARARQVITQDGRLDLYQAAGKLPIETLPPLDASMIYVEKGGALSDVPNLLDRLLAIEREVAAVRNARRQMALLPNAEATTVTPVGLPAPTLSGSLIAASDASGPMLQHLTSSTAGNAVGVLPPAMNMLRADWKPRLSAVVTIGNIADCRCWVGMFASDPSGSSDPVADLAGFRYDPTFGSSPTEWMAATADGTTRRAVRTGIVVAAKAYRLELDVDRDLGRVRFWIDGKLVHTQKANLPRAGINMGYGLRLTTLVANARSLKWTRLNVEHA
jgi:hypothetical protein